MTEPLPVWSPPVNLPSGIRLVQTLRGGEGWGFNLAGHVGAPAAEVARHRARLQAQLTGIDQIQWLTQIHGIDVVEAPSAVNAEADAQWTTQAGVACVVMTADCLPLLFWRADASLVGAIHAGWRGLAAGVIETTVRALPPSASALQVWLGPRIGTTAFEVGDEVRAAFVAHSPAASAAFVASSRAGHWLGDLGALARLRLKGLGITHVTDSAACTVTESQRWFSFRRDGQCGRMASVIWRAQ
ncbi:peptidoglycan editing factor PgeF [Polycyclovorans algicola]|uniref:peptidoglycan editing factor PgeF n=1 Tax=Polycyclovorans algicola TaxID=616992 RepID=UPI0004A77147|nr:peptidoglycan editing factor PgeF [Polycyclovorans algicola]